MSTPKSGNQTSANAGTVPTPAGNPNLEATKAPQTPAANKPNKPGRKPGQKPREWDYSGLDATFLADAHGVTAELASLAAPMRARDERQVAMDKVVATLHAEWLAAGKPERWSQMPKRSYHVAPQVADTVRMLVRRAASFLGLSAKFGKPVRDREGREIVVFAVRDMRVRATKAEDTVTLEFLREFVTEFFAEDTEGAEAFLTGLTETDENGEEDSEDSDSE